MCFAKLNVLFNIHNFVKEIIEKWYSMQSLFIFIAFIFIVGCNTSPGRKITNLTNKKQQEICNENYDSLMLGYAYDFNAKNIRLDKDLSTGLDSFLIHTDTNCLRKQGEYKFFIAIILSKLCYYHLKCCNQGYDLLSMRNGGAKVIIDEFRRMSGYQNQHLDMLNSEFIIHFIEQDPTLKENSLIKDLLNKLNREERRIEKGNI